MKINRALYIVAFLITSLVSCSKSAAAPVDPTKVLLEEGFVFESGCNCYRNQSAGSIVRLNGNVMTIDVGPFGSNGMPNDSAGTALNNILIKIYDPIVAQWVFTNLPIAGAQLVKNLPAYSGDVVCGSTELNGEASNYSITISMTECYPVTSNLLIRLAPRNLPNVGSKTAVVCQDKPFRQEQVVSLLKAGAVIVYERNGGTNCVDELYSIYPNGRIVGDNGTTKTELQITSAEVDKLLLDITDIGWFTDEIYDTWHARCEQCFGNYLTVSYKGQEKTAKAVDGDPDSPANYWLVISMVNGVIPKFTP